MRSGLLSIILVTMILGFDLGLYTRQTFPNLGRRFSQPSVAGTGQVAPPLRGPVRGVRPSPSDDSYNALILLVGLVAAFAAIMTGFGTRLEGDYSTRAMADAVITLAVISLMLLVVEIVVSLFAPPILT